MVNNRPYRLLQPEKAEELAATLNAEDEGATYKVVHDPKGTGYSFIEIWEVEEFIARL